MNFVATIEGKRWTASSGSEPGTVEECLADFDGWHEDVHLLIRNIGHLVTLDARRRVLRDAWLLAEGGIIRSMGTGPVPRVRAEVVNARGGIATPGMINTHHHMVQSLTRAVPGGQNAELFTWLKSLYPIWAGLTPEMVTTSHQVAMAELLLSGCTTSSDHHYI